MRHSKTPLTIVVSFLAAGLANGSQAEIQSMSSGEMTDTYVKDSPSWSRQPKQRKAQAGGHLHHFTRRTGQVRCRIAGRI